MVWGMERGDGGAATGKRARSAPSSRAGYPALQHVERRWVAQVLGLVLAGAALGGCPEAPVPDAGPRPAALEKKKLQGEMTSTGY